MSDVNAMEIAVDFGSGKMFWIAKFLMDFTSVVSCVNMHCHVDETSVNTLEIRNDPERYVNQIRLDREF